jgi:hypothetical protein
MVLKLFLFYIGSLLACSIILLNVVKRFAEGFAGSGKKPVVYGTFSSVIASVAAYACTYVDQHLFTVFWLLSGIFLLFGIIHMVIVHDKYFSSYNQNSSKVLLGEVLFALSVVLFTIVVFSSLQYFLKENKDFLFYPMMMSTLAFFIPVLVLQTFQAAYDIPEPVYTTWTYPINQTIDIPPENPREKILVIGFELAKKNSDTKRTYFRAKAPEHMELGQLFYFFINDYNELQSETPIEYADNQYEPYDWWFRKKTKWYERLRILDPMISVKDNGIVENTVIICERIQKPA